MTQRILNWLRRILAITPVDTYKPTTGICQCGHMQCYHSDGRRNCWFTGGRTYICMCAKYIQKSDPVAEELERIARL